MLDIERWDVFELAFESNEAYENPFVDVELKASFLHTESGRAITVDGFYDGGHTWRIRLMPLELGEWTYTTQSNDTNLDGQTGSLNCVSPQKSYLHGPLYAKGYHFQHADGTWRYLTSTRVSSQFGSQEVSDRVGAFLHKHNINRVFFIMGGRHSTIRDLYGPDLDFSRYNVEKFQLIDRFIDSMRKADVLAGPYLYYFNDRDQCEMTEDEDRAYIRYSMARFGAYCNVLPCLSNQVEGKHTLQGLNSATEYDPRNHVWANQMGDYLKEKAVFGVPVTVHNPLENERATNPSFYTYLRGWQFPWADYMLRQMQVGALGAVSDFPDDLPEQSLAGSVKGGNGAVFGAQYNPRAYANQNLLLTELRQFNIPVINEEPGYEMQGRQGHNPRIKPQNYNSQTSETLLTTFWTAAMAGAYSMWGSVETYHLEDPLPGLENSVVPQYFRVLHDVMTALPYWEMEPNNEVVSPYNLEVEDLPWRTNFGYVKEGEVYVIFSTYGGEIEVTLPEGGTYQVTLVNPRWGNETDLGTVSGGVQPLTLHYGEWVLLFKRIDG